MLVARGHFASLGSIPLDIDEDSEGLVFRRTATRSVEAVIYDGDNYKFEWILLDDNGRSQIDIVQGGQLERYSLLHGVPLTRQYAGIVNNLKQAEVEDAKVAIYFLCEAIKKAGTATGSFYFLCRLLIHLFDNPFARYYVSCGAHGCTVLFLSITNSFKCCDHVFI